MKTYSVFAEGISAQASIGVTEAERAFPQKILIDLEVESELPSNNAEYSDIGKLTDYSELSSRCIEISEEQPWQTLEELAEALCRELLDAFPLIIEISIELRKMVVANTTAVGIRFSEAREGF